MERAAISGAGEPEPGGTAGHRLTDALGTSHLAINHYRLAPGEALPAGLHAHGDQEEVFVVLEGAAGFETLLPPDGGEPAGDVTRYEPGAIAVSAGEVVRFAPGDYQSGRNVADTETRLLALGAPAESDDLRLPVACPNCSVAPIRLGLDGEFTFECEHCGTSSDPAPCPECGSDSLEVTLGDADEPEVECQDCATTYETPPIA